MSTGEENGSVSQDLSDLHIPDKVEQAQADLYRRYCQTVLNQARRRVDKLRVVDASDVAISVWETIFRGIERGKIQCKDRIEFEELLGKITRRKAINLYRWFTRSIRHANERIDDVGALERSRPLEQDLEIAKAYYSNGLTAPSIASDKNLDVSYVEERLRHIGKAIQRFRYKPIPSGGSEVLESAPTGDRPEDIVIMEEILLSLDERLRETVLLILEGRTKEQVAASLSDSVRTVERRLALLKELLKAEFLDD